MPKVSVIMPSYNHEKYISDAIESVLNQNFKDFELTVIDDFSEDKSVELIKNYQKKDRRIRCLFHNRNKGIAKTFNDGLMASKGEYIAFIASDDIWEKTRLETGLKILENYRDFDIVHSDSLIIDDKSMQTDKKFSLIHRSPEDKYSGNLFNALLKGNFISGSSVFLRKKCTEGILFNEELKYLNDWLFWIEISLNHKFYYVNDPLTRYRIHGNNTNKDVMGYRFDTIKMLCLVLEKYESSISNSGKSKIFQMLGEESVHLQDIENAMKFFKQSFKYKPYNLNCLLFYLIMYINYDFFLIMLNLFRFIKRKLAI